MERPYLLKTWHWVGLFILQILLFLISAIQCHNKYYTVFIFIVTAITCFYGFKFIKSSYLYDKHAKEKHLKEKPVRKRKTK